MALTRAQVAEVLCDVLSVVPDAEIRLVGTASSLLRGIDLPAGDIDILFRHRSGVDEWFAALQHDAIVETSLRWLPAWGQYFVELIVDGVKVGLSTVESDSDTDTVECHGRGPWLYFDELDIDGVSVPVVASELRLVSEFVRARPARLDPILKFLRATGCDLDLVRRGLANSWASSTAASATAPTTTKPSPGPATTTSPSKPHEHRPKLPLASYGPWDVLTPTSSAAQSARKASTGRPRRWRRTARCHAVAFISSGSSGLSV